MAINFLNTINLNKNQLNQAALENLTSDPATGVLGQVYYNTTDDEIKVCTTASTSAPTNAVWDAVGSVETYTLPVSAGTAVAGSTVADIDLTAAGATTGIKSRVTFAGKNQNILISETVGNNGIVNIALTDEVTIADSLTVSQDATIGNDLVVENNTKLEGAVTTDTDVEVGGDLKVISDAFFEGTAFEINANTAIDFGANKITNVANPTSTQDAATKAYVDTSVTGLLQFISGFNASTGAIVSGGNLTNGAARVAIEIGDYYVVTVAGDFFGDASTPLTPGDSVIAQVASAAGASSITDFIVVQSDTDLATDAIVGLGNVKASAVGFGIEGISVTYANPTNGTATIGLDISNLNRVTEINDNTLSLIPIFDDNTGQNAGISVGNLFIEATKATSKSGIIDAGDLSGIVTHSFGATTMVQTFDSTTGETIFCEVVRGTSSPYTVTATISAAYANDIIILVQKINS